MDDFMIYAADFTTKYGAWLLVVFVVLVLSIIVWFVLSRKYPRVTFEILEGKIKNVEYRRLFGDKVVPDNLIQILIDGEKILGFKISEYDYIYYGNERRYLATRRGDELIPLRIKDNEIQLEELGFAREIAMRYVNTIDSTKEDLNKQNPLVLALLSVLPISVLVILTGVMFFLILNDAFPKFALIYTDVSKNTLEAAKYNAEVAKLLAQQNPPQPAMQNITIQQPALPR